MKIKHPSVSVRSYVLRRTLEFDTALGEDEVPIRVEIFESVDLDGHFRCLLWEREMMRLTPTFPRDHDDEPAHIADESLMLERPGAIGHKYRDFEADSVDAAIRTVLADCLWRIEQLTGKKGSIAG
jgi:hypothetical protein